MKVRYAFLLLLVSGCKGSAEDGKAKAQESPAPKPPSAAENCKMLCEATGVKRFESAAGLSGSTCECLPKKVEEEKAE